MNSLGHIRFQNILNSIPSPWKEQLTQYQQRGWDFQFFLAPYENQMFLALLGKKKQYQCISIATQTEDLFTNFLMDLAIYENPNLTP